MRVIDFIGIALAMGGVLLLVSSLLSRIGNRIGLPVSLLFLAIGMVAGSDGPGGIWFDRFDIAYACGTAALVMILFAGGLNTRVRDVRLAVAPAAVLATVGVVGIAALTAAGAHWLGLTWPEALLIGAIVSSTDAAAVFAVLEGVPLRRRVARTIELESGLNDPVAVILTTAATLNLAGEAPAAWTLATGIVLQLILGLALGVSVGALGRWLLRHVRLSTPALLPTVTVAVAMIAYGVATELGGSGFLAVYVAGIAIGNGDLPHQVTLQRFHESFAWLAQVAMFLMLGLLVFPSELPTVAGLGLLLALFLAIVARPVVVAVCLLPFRFQWREILCIAWLGLRGAVPIILATVPVLMLGTPHAPERDLLDEFDLVFFVVVIGSFIPGMTVRWLPRLLRLEEPVAPEPAASIDITTSAPMREAQRTFFIAPSSPAADRTLSELPLPQDVTVMLIVRGSELIAPRGTTRLNVGDHAFVLCAPHRLAAVARIFEA
ncbi:potassium/proton antiporter [bacterium]|nr:potassium/proton antiporter [bacterium]